MHALITTGVNAAGHRGILGIDVAALRTARPGRPRLSGVAKMISHDHAGLVNATATNITVW